MANTRGESQIFFSRIHVHISSMIAKTKSGGRYVRVLRNGLQTSPSGQIIIIAAPMIGSWMGYEILWRFGLVARALHCMFALKVFTCIWKIPFVPLFFSFGRMDGWMCQMFKGTELECISTFISMIGGLLWWYKKMKLRAEELAFVGLIYIANSAGGGKKIPEIL
ncbi:hypothetical protein DFH27DRAFT_66999 [Peziza echinospora]|nr:hypothetical protein DFH27DRAFT_66999 [Peziza echinospora]